MEWPHLREELTATAARVADLLRALPTDDPPATGAGWSVAEIGAHLVGLPRRYRRLAGALHPFPASLSRDNQRELAEVPERDHRALADLLTAEVAELLDALGPDGRRPVWYFTVAHTAAGLGAVMLTELLMHGLDLAGAAGRPWPITRGQAAACLSGVLPAIVLSVDRAAARAADGTYQLHVRGGHDWTIRIDDGVVTVEPGRPARADLHFSVDPVAFLLSSYGRLGRARAMLTGGLFAWGRRPWLAGRFGRAFVDS